MVKVEGVAAISRGVEYSAILQSAVILHSDIIAFGWCLPSASLGDDLLDQATISLHLDDL